MTLILDNGSDDSSHTLSPKLVCPVPQLSKRADSLGSRSVLRRSRSMAVTASLTSIDLELARWDNHAAHAATTTPNAPMPSGTISPQGVPMHGSYRPAAALVSYIRHPLLAAKTAECTSASCPFDQLRVGLTRC